MLTLKVNIRAKEERERKERERQAKANNLKIPATSLPQAGARKRKGLNFHEPGTFIAKAEQLRKKAKFEALQKKIAAAAAKTGITDAVKLASLTTSNKLLDPNKVLKKDSKEEEKKEETKEQAPYEEEEEVPDIEWWDKTLLRDRPLDEVILRLKQKNENPENIFNGITNLIEHPPVKKPPGPVVNTVDNVPMFLTEKERKKLRRLNRKTAELEKQEQIKLSLIPKPEPKLKRSNIMFALGNEAIVNPSMAEIMVSKQEEKRLQAHIEHNEARKLSSEEKRQKKLRKVQEDLSVTGTWVSVYRILNLTSQAHKFKVTQNAKQLTMTGVMILCKDINLVVVEGGPKQQRRFKHLMLDRINWSEDPILANETNNESHMDNGSYHGNVKCHNKCLLVWEGQVNQRSFRGFQVEQMKSESEARTFFQLFKVEHYWDLAFNMSILESIEDT